MAAPASARCGRRIFRAHVRVARAVGKPLVVHVLRAHDAAPRILREEGPVLGGVVLHSYSGGADLVPVYAALGCAFSFAGPVTYPGARRPVEARAPCPPSSSSPRPTRRTRPPPRTAAGAPSPGFYRR